MKKIILIATLGFVFANGAFAKEEKLKMSTGGLVLADMLVRNSAGVAKLNATATKGYALEKATVTIVSDDQPEGDHGISTTVVRYVLNFQDSAGGDVIDGTAKWTVLETITSDGYSSKSEYKSTIERK